MSSTPMIRPGGRSERIQLAVHEAVRALQEEGAVGLTIPMIAARADVTPSTIYRRWRNVEDLLAAVAAHDFRPDAELADTGSLPGDLAVWLANFVDDLSTGVGKTLVRERVANMSVAQIAATYAFENFETLVARAVERGEPAPTPDRLMDLLVAPTIYRLVFIGQVIEEDYQAELIALALSSGAIGVSSSSQGSIGSSQT